MARLLVPALFLAALCLQFLVWASLRGCEAYLVTAHDPRTSRYYGLCLFSDFDRHGGAGFEVATRDPAKADSMRTCVERYIEGLELTGAAIDQSKRGLTINIPGLVIEDFARLTLGITSECRTEDLEVLHVEFDRGGDLAHKVAYARKVLLAAFALTLLATSMWFRSHRPPTARGNK